MKDYYAILEISPNATQDRIREQYRFLLHAWHPDKFPNPEQKRKANERTKEINEAESILCDSVKRAQYDREMSFQSSPTNFNEGRQREEAEYKRQAEENELKKRKKAERQEKKRAERRQKEEQRIKILVGPKLKAWGYILTFLWIVLIPVIIYFVNLQEWAGAFLGAVVVFWFLVGSLQLIRKREVYQDTIILTVIVLIIPLPLIGWKIWEHNSTAHDLGRLDKVLLTLKNQDYEIRTEAVKRLGNILVYNVNHQPQVVQALIDSLRDPHPVVREEAAKALYTPASPLIVAALVSTLADVNESVRREAVRSLGRLKALEARQQLNWIGRMDPSPKVRKTAAWALWRIGDIGFITWILCDFAGMQLPADKHISSSRSIDGREK